MAKKVSKSRPMSVMAPYNFIPFENKVSKVDEKVMQVRGKLSNDLISGEISYTVQAKTPIFVDDGNEQFYKDEYNRYAIPGTTMRGLVRANALVLGMGDYSNDIEDYRLMYRNVANGAEKYRYNEILGNRPVKIGKDDNNNDVCISILKNVRAGYIANENNKYVIYGTKVEQVSKATGKVNYYVLNEKNIQTQKSEKGFKFFKKHPDFLQHNLEREFVKSVDRRDRVHYNGTKNKSYKPFYVEITYENKDRVITAVGEKGEYSHKGYLMGTGPMNEKKALYVIPEISEKMAVDINYTYKQSLVDFKRDLEARRNSLKRYQCTSFFELPKKGKIKPVFYIELDGKLYFGFTPRLRLFYDYAIKEGYRVDSSKFDYVKSIFGCIDGKVGYKSKVSFSDAVVMGDANGIISKKVILGEPKPTSYLDYLVQNEGEVTNTYNSKGFELRGAKKFWLHRDVVESESNGNDNVKSAINALPKDTKFEGKIRFQNLTEAELGLLIWSLRLEEESEVNIGKAKAYGFGRCKVEDVVVNCYDLNKAYNTEKFDLDPFDENCDKDNYILAYKAEVKNKYNIEIDELESVQALMLMTDSTRIPNNELTRYMELGKKDSGYRMRINELIPLPLPSEVVYPNDSGTRKSHHNNNPSAPSGKNKSNSKGNRRSNDRGGYNKKQESTGYTPFANIKDILK